MFKQFFASRLGIIITGALVGLLAIALQQWGNPPNMGICVACFTRDITGSLGLHRAGVVQYMRPEIFGIILGSLVSALAFGDFKSRSGSMPALRFVLGAFAMIGALAFLGCPWRTALRIAGGDINAWIGLAGLIAGIFVGTRFFIAGYNPGSATPTRKAVGWAFPAITLLFLLLTFWFLPIAGEAKNGIFLYSTSGPGSMRAPVWGSLLIGLFIGFIIQRSRFCTIGGIRDFILFRQTHLLMGIVSLTVVALVANLVVGKFNFGMQSQPIAHTDAVWNFLGMMLSGLAFSLAGGCPGRQLVLAGEGDADASVFVIGMVAGAAFAHNFGLAASATGIGVNGMVAVVLGLLVCMSIAISMREK